MERFGEPFIAIDLKCWRRYCDLTSSVWRAFISSRQTDEVWVWHTLTQPDFGHRATPHKRGVKCYTKFAIFIHKIRLLYFANMDRFMFRYKDTEYFNVIYSIRKSVGWLKKEGYDRGWSSASRELNGTRAI